MFCQQHRPSPCSPRQTGKLPCRRTTTNQPQTARSTGCVPQLLPPKALPSWLFTYLETQENQSILKIKVHSWNITGENVKCRKQKVTVESILAVSYEVKCKLTYNPAIPHLHYLAERNETYVHTKICTWMFMAPVFLTAKNCGNYWNIHELGKQNVAFPYRRCNPALKGRKCQYEVQHAWNSKPLYKVKVRHKRSQIVRFHLYDTSRTGKSTETGRRLVVV